MAAKLKGNSPPVLPPAIEIPEPEIIVDEEFRALIPPLATEEREQLEQNLIDDGCREPLTVWRRLIDRDGDGYCKYCDEETEVIFGDGVWQCEKCDSGLYAWEYDLVLIDGHNRFEICTSNAIEFETIGYDFDDRDDVKLWIIDNQFGRRNLADIDRISLARRREEILRPKAKENLKLSKGRGKKGLPKSANLKPIDTRQESAKAAGVGKHTYDAGKLILDAVENGEVSQDDLEKIRRKEKSIHRVAKDLKEKRQKEKRHTERKAAAAKAEPQFFDNLHVGDFREHANKIADGSLSLIFTDPPYDRKAIELYDGLGEFAAAKLCEGGSLITYVGHIQLPSAVASLEEHLRYWWTVCCLHSGSKNLMTEYGIRCGWKPVLWFVKGTRDDKEAIVSDVMSGGREKDHHDWQQSQSEAAYWIDQLCPTDGIVCDPFLGGGTTAAAAIELQRKWVAFEKDHDQAVIAMQRCKQ